MILLTESGQLEPSASASAVDRVTEAARLLGFAVYPIPASFEDCETAENALWLVPHQSPPIAAVWAGYLPSAERYEAIYHAAEAKGVRLLNDPPANEVAMRLDRAYPLLEGLTPTSIILSSPSEAAAAGDQLGYPVFVKGAVQSAKNEGRRMCIADDRAELETLVAALLRRSDASRSVVVVRRLVPLRHKRTTGLGLPVGREYRFFVFEGETLESGYYWPDEDDFGSPTTEEAAAMQRLVHDAAEQLRIPYVAVDIGQVDDGGWLVIEANDAQFAGLVHVPILPLLTKLAARAGR
jgi:hypothetical protein